MFILSLLVLQQDSAKKTVIFMTLGLPLQFARLHSPRNEVWTAGLYALKYMSKSLFPCGWSWLRTDLEHRTGQRETRMDSKTMLIAYTLDPASNACADVQAFLVYHQKV